MGEGSSQLQMALGHSCRGSVGPGHRSSPVGFTPRSAHTGARPRPHRCPSSPAPPSPLSRAGPPLAVSSPAPTLQLWGALVVCCAESFCSLQAVQIRAILFLPKSALMLKRGAFHGGESTLCSPYRRQLWLRCFSLLHVY